MGQTKKNTFSYQLFQELFIFFLLCLIKTFWIFYLIDYPLKRWKILKMLEIVWGWKKIAMKNCFGFLFFFFCILFICLFIYLFLIFFLFSQKSPFLTTSEDNKIEMLIIAIYQRWKGNVNLYPKKKKKMLAR